MPDWALAASIGPVGGFIAAGRRSRDLWWGSTWASECTLAVAAHLGQGGSRGLAVKLIVPTPERVAKIRDLAAGERRGRYEERISNRILARVEAASEGEVRELAGECEGVAGCYLAAQVRWARKHCAKRSALLGAALAELLDEAALERQLEEIEKGDFVEVHAAWAPWPVNGDPSATAPPDCAARLLDARKRARLFVPPTWSRDGFRRSDLDPGRDSVFKPTPELNHDGKRGPDPAARLQRRRLGVGPDEGLDAVGLGRRIAVFADADSPRLGALPFPPLSRVAFDPWLEAADREARPALDAVGEVLWAAKDRNDEIFYTWCSPARDPETPIEEADRAAGRFPYDASFLMEGGLDALRRELELTKRRGGEIAAGVDSALADLHKLRTPVSILHKGLGVPQPYYALLMMDGDGVGRRLAAQRHSDDMTRLVEGLYSFADEAERTVRAQHGCAFYIGGDELAAYLPLDSALHAAQALAEELSRQPWPGAPLTLSGGLVVAHLKADLRAVRRLAQEALEQAKEQRRRAASQEGWLEIVELPRSGEPRRSAGPVAELYADLQEWKQLLRHDHLSLRTPHLLADLALRFADGDSEDGGRRGLELALGRVLGQWARSDKEPESPRLLERLRGAETWRQVRRLADEIAIAGRMMKVEDLRRGHRREGTS